VHRVDIRDVEAEEGGCVRPLRFRIEPHDDRVADAELSMADNAVFVHDPREFLCTEGPFGEFDHAGDVS
jgi:hypothetical protein